MYRTPQEPERGPGDVPAAGEDGPPGAPLAPLGPRRSIAALIPSFAIAQAAVAFGIPVSFNEIVVSAIIGSGYAAGGGGVSRRKMLYTVLAWIGSLLLALGLGYGVFTAIDAVVA